MSEPNAEPIERDFAALVKTTIAELEAAKTIAANPPRRDRWVKQLVEA